MLEFSLMMIAMSIGLHALAVHPVAGTNDGIIAFFAGLAVVVVAIVAATIVVVATQVS